MKLLLLACTVFMLTTSCQDGASNDIIGEWVNPYTYESTGEFKGFNLKKNGIAEEINVPSWDLKSWKIVDGKLCIEGFDIDEETGDRTISSTSQEITQLTKDTLQVLALEVPRTTFLYVKKKFLIKSKK